MTVSTSGRAPDAASPTRARTALDKLFFGLYGSDSVANPAGPDDARVAQALAKADPAAGDLLVHVRAALGAAALTPWQTGCVRAAAQVLGDFFRQPAFHPSLGQRLLASSGVLVAEALRSDGWLLDRHHSLAGFLARLGDRARGWYPQHPQADEITSLMERCLRGLTQATQAETMAVFDQWWVNLDGRVNRVAERVVQAESGTLRTRYARALAARTINRQVAGRDLPEFMASTLGSQWLACFQWVLLQEGDRSPLWMRLVKTFGLLVWTLQPDSVSQQAKLRKVTEQLRHELPQVLAEVMSDAAQREQLLEQVSVAHLCLMHGREIEYCTVEPLEDGGLVDGLDAEVSQDLLQEVSTIEPSQWFIETQTAMRLRLLHRDDSYRQLLFTNQLGVRALVCSFEDFAFRFSAGEIVAVQEVIPLGEWTQSCLQALALDYKRKQQHRHEEDRAAQALHEKQTETRKRAQEKARDEARALQASLASTPWPAAASNPDGAAESDQPAFSAAQLRQRARLVISSLSVGAWLNFIKEGEAVRRRLAVVLPSSNKYIFTDRVGANKLQFTREELIEAVTTGTAVLVQQDSGFDAALSRVVDGLRR